MNRKPSSTEDRRADGSLWYKESRLCEWRRLMCCTRRAEEQWCSSGVKEVQDAEAGRHTLPGVDLRFSWFLSRRLRKRETPELFIAAEYIHSDMPEDGGGSCDVDVDGRVGCFVAGVGDLVWARQVRASSWTVLMTVSRGHGVQAGQEAVE